MSETTKNAYWYFHGGAAVGVSERTGKKERTLAAGKP